MPPRNRGPDGDQRAHRRMLISCFLGTTIEWYDFLVYGFLAPLVFNTLFFPVLSPLSGTIAVFGVFAVGFAARPLGGVFFAHFGDRVGRKPIMVSTLVLMGASTTAIGLTPTYAHIGIAAPLILVVLRFLQGFSLGGESAAGPLLAMESAPGTRAACSPPWSRVAPLRAPCSARSPRSPSARCLPSSCSPGAGASRSWRAHRFSRLAFTCA